MAGVFGRKLESVLQMEDASGHFCMSNGAAVHSPREPQGLQTDCFPSVGHVAHCCRDRNRIIVENISAPKEVTF